MQIFNQIFQNVATLLLIPVLLILSWLFIQSLFKIGQFVESYKTRKSIKLKWLTIINEELGEESNEYFYLAVKEDPSVSFYWNKIGKTKKESMAEDRVFQQFEMENEKKLQVFRSYLRLGPMLGLMGTLIPMGPALTGLALGDVASMAGHMQVAFSTTVVGVFLGAIGYGLYNKEKEWLAHKILFLEYLSGIESLDRNSK